MFVPAFGFIGRDDDKRHIERDCSWRAAPR
jgi:hypothetical protein